ncbi:porin family protein [Rhizobium sp. CFBP 13726]|uniref:outer membrane protein n=1 Tax=Rhizobium sp. CFBP 13726 TaxID=2775296 RepID=UPI00177BE2CA|nr:outer membrane protein [Rhizobium sp. CFBP 13726]MBD8651481.1 porin family protein [Rhizobium sp. CFBP 13726]
MKRSIASLFVVAMVCGLHSPSSATDWDGAYLGAHLGGSLADFDWWFRPLPGGSPNNQVNHDGSGLLAGAQIGYDWQIGSWVVGINAEAAKAHVQGSARCPGRSWSCESDAQWVGSAKARFGYSFSDVLLYTTGGVGFSKLEAVSQRGSDRGEIDRTHAGWVIGGGVEYSITEQWSVKGEFLHYDFTDRPYQRANNDIIVDTGYRLNNVTIGVNRRF